MFYADWSYQSGIIFPFYKDKTEAISPFKFQPLKFIPIGIVLTYLINFRKKINMFSLSCCVILYRAQNSRKS